MARASESLERLRGGLVVSCQAPAGSPLRATPHMVAMARAAVAGGACGIRAEGADDVASIVAAVDVPVVGLRKLRVHGTEVYITPTLAAAAEIVAAGAGVLAVDATLRERAAGVTAPAFVRALRAAHGDDLALLADVDGLEAGLRAREAGADAVATTLSGYTGAGATPDGPDLELVAALSARLDCPVLAEGRIATEADVRRAFEAGAHAVVVGAAITDPVVLTRRLAGAAVR